MSVRGWRVAGAGYVYVGGNLHWERRWGAGVNKRALTMNGCGWGGGRKEGKKNDPELIEVKGGAEGLD